jgi:hypothetical protein
MIRTNEGCHVKCGGDINFVRVSDGGRNKGWKMVLE